MRKYTKRGWRTTKVSLEAIADFGLSYFINHTMAYNKGFKGKSYRTGIAGDDFVMNMVSIMVDVIRAPRIATPQKRLHKFSNRKINRIR